MTEQTWMITGTSSGFGKALATQLAQADQVNLIATARKIHDLDYLDQYDHGQIKKILVDVSKPDEIKAAAAAAIDFKQRIDVLVKNAGLGYFSTIE
jgi:NADP-dependent 3-hydroxy acid dehydrogenase YdfG